MDEGTCPSCGAKILFAKDQDGTTHPLNKRRVRVYFETGTGVCYRIRTETKKDQLVLVPELYYISHYTTCTDPSRHSKKRTPHAPN